MSLFIQNNSGPIYNGCTVTIQNGQTVVEPHKKDTTRTDVQEVAFEEMHSVFALLTDLCRKENKVQTVEAELRAACKGKAVELWRTIRTNEALGYLSALRLSTAKVYRAFTDFFGDLPYTERNFRDARDKA